MKTWRWSLVLAAIVLIVVQADRAEGLVAVPVDRLRITLERVPDELGIRQRIAAFFREVRLRAVGPALPRPGARYRVTAVAYSSTVDQTDLTPCITAAGTYVRHGVVATNFLPLGTQLRIGDELYVVEDRMNERYNGKYIVDIWHPTREQAQAFGAQLIEIEIAGRAELISETDSPRSSEPDRTSANPFFQFLRFVFGSALLHEGECVAALSE